MFQSSSVVFLLYCQMRHSEGNRLVGREHGNVGSHPPLEPAVPSLSHSHCNKAFQISTSSDSPRRKSLRMGKDCGWRLACCLLVSPCAADVHQQLSGFPAALAPDARRANTCPMATYHSLQSALIEPPLISSSSSLPRITRGVASFS